MEFNAFLTPIDERFAVVTVSALSLKMSVDF